MQIMTSDCRLQPKEEAVIEVCEVFKVSEAGIAAKSEGHNYEYPDDDEGSHVPEHEKRR